MIEAGPNARSVQIKLNPFTLVGATTRSGLLTAPLRARFGINSRLEYYSVELLKDIVHRSAEILQVPIEEEAAIEIARRSRGTPVEMDRQWPFAPHARFRSGEGRRSDHPGDRTLRSGCTASRLFGPGRYGPPHPANDHREIPGRASGHNHHRNRGGRTGRNSVEEVYEPYLIQEGFLQRTPRGRMATDRAYKHLGLNVARPDSDLFNPPA